MIDNNEIFTKDIIMMKVADIKGTSEEDIIYLIGNKEGQGKNTIYKNMEMIVSDGGDGKLDYIDLVGIEGYEAKIKIEKYNDKKQLIFIIKEKDERKGIRLIIYQFNLDGYKIIYDSNYYNKSNYEVIYKNNYELDIYNSEKEKIYIMDIKNRGEGYLRSKYNKDGEVKNKISGDVLPIYKMMSIKDDEKDYSNLLTKRKIIGEDFHDIMGELIEIFILESDGFKLVERSISNQLIKNSNLDYRSAENSRYNFSNMEFLEAEYNEDIKLERAIEKEYSLIPNYDKLNYLYNRVKISEVDTNQIIAYLEGPKFCSEKGGTLLVLDEKNNNYYINSKIRNIIPPIIVSNKRTNGYNNLIVKTINDGKEEFRVLKYNGNSYPIDPLKEEKLKKGIKITGIAVIADDLFYRKGIEY